MTMTFDEDKPSPADALHYGKKGMKWGVRKKYSTAEIHGARRRQMARGNGLANLETKAVNAKPGAAKKRAEAAFNKAEKAANSTKDAAIGSRLTRGEKTAAVLLAGPLGLIVIGANAAAVRKQDKKSGLRK